MRVVRLESERVSKGTGETANMRLKVVKSGRVSIGIYAGIPVSTVVCMVSKRFPINGFLPWLTCGAY